MQNLCSSQQGILSPYAKHVLAISDSLRCRVKVPSSPESSNSQPGWQKTPLNVLHNISTYTCEHPHNLSNSEISNKNPYYQNHSNLLWSFFIFCNRRVAAVEKQVKCGFEIVCRYIQKLWRCDSSLKRLRTSYCRRATAYWIKVYHNGELVWFLNTASYHCLHSQHLHPLPLHIQHYLGLKQHPPQDKYKINQPTLSLARSSSQYILG